MKSMEPAYGGSQAATIMMKEENAKRIIQSGGLRVDLLVCKELKWKTASNARTTGTDLTTAVEESLL